MKNILMFALNRTGNILSLLLNLLYLSTVIAPYSRLSGHPRVRRKEAVVENGRYREWKN